MNRRIAIAVGALLLAPGGARAESAPRSSYGAHGYAFFAAGRPFDDPDAAIAAGGGGEGFLGNGWSLGGELA